MDINTEGIDQPETALWKFYKTMQIDDESYDYKQLILCSILLSKDIDEFLNDKSH